MSDHDARAMLHELRVARFVAEHGERELLRPSPVRLVAPLLAYALTKAPGATPEPAAAWAAVHDRRCAVSPEQYAALNGVSKAQARVWAQRLYDVYLPASRLSGAYGALDAIAAELDELGRQAIASAGPGIGQAEEGDPRGILPDPEPPGGEKKEGRRAELQEAMRQALAPAPVAATSKRQEGRGEA